MLRDYGALPTPEPVAGDCGPVVAQAAADAGVELVQSGGAFEARFDARVLTAALASLLDALGAVDILAGQGIQAGVLHAHTVKPLDDDAILSRARDVEAIVTVEEHTLVGGLGSAVVDGSGTAFLVVPVPLAAAGLIDGLHYNFAGKGETTKGGGPNFVHGHRTD